jgi:hypothetical protein
MFTAFGMQSCVITSTAEPEALVPSPAGEQLSLGRICAILWRTRKHRYFSFYFLLREL